MRTQNQQGLCVESVTAGGADLAREPVMIGLSGTNASIELTLRDDCASLQLSLPDAQSSIAAGEETFYTVYVVPDFPSTAEIEPATLRASTGGSMTVNGHAGNYHVYTFAALHSFPTGIAMHSPPPEFPPRQSRLVPAQPATWWWRRLHNDALLRSHSHSRNCSQPASLEFSFGARANRALAQKNGSGLYHIAGAVLNAGHRCAGAVRYRHPAFRRRQPPHHVDHVRE